MLKLLIAVTILAANIAHGFRVGVNTETGMFTDHWGRSLIFHGQNVVVKLPNYLPTVDTFDWQMSISD